MGFDVTCDRCGKTCEAHDTIFDGNRRICDDCDTEIYLSKRGYVKTTPEFTIPPSNEITMRDYILLSVVSAGMLAFFYVLTVVWP